MSWNSFSLRHMLPIWTVPSLGTGITVLNSPQQRKHGQNSDLRCAKNFSTEDFLKGFCLQFNHHTHLLLALKDHYKPLEKECYWTKLDAWLLSSPLLLLADILKWCSIFKGGQIYPHWYVERVSTKVIQGKTLSTEICSAVSVHCASKRLTHEK